MDVHTFGRCDFRINAFAHDKGASRLGPVADDAGQAELEDAWAARVAEVWQPAGLDRAIGSRVRSIREAAGMSQRRFAASMRVSQTVLSKIENGERRLSLLDALQIALAYRVPLTSLVPPELAELFHDIDRDVR